MLWCILPILVNIDVAQPKTKASNRPMGTKTCWCQNKRLAKSQTNKLEFVVDNNKSLTKRFTKKSLVTTLRKEVK